jgi:hypothetical protein
MGKDHVVWGLMWLYHADAVAWEHFIQVLALFLLSGFTIGQYVRGGPEICV